MEKKLKRRFERGDFCNEMKARVRKMMPNKKKLKLTHLRDLNTSKLERGRLLDVQHSSESQFLFSDMTSSEQDDSEEDDAICPAVNCLQPEGDEVN